MHYCKEFVTEDEAIAHCREVNRGLSSTDPRCCAVVGRSGEENDHSHCVVVDLETATWLLDAMEFMGVKPLPYLIVTD